MKQDIFIVTAEERRRAPRFAPVREIHVTCEGRDQIIRLRPHDISLHGMFISTAVIFPEGSVLKIRFCLNQTDIEVETRAEVRYCSPGVGIGVEFVGLTDGACAAITRELEAHLSPEQVSRIRALHARQKKAK
jgi:hypothetical protein